MGYLQSADQETLYEAADSTEQAALAEYEYTNCGATYAIGSSSTLRPSTDDVEALYLEPRVVSGDGKAETLRRLSDQEPAGTLRRPSIMIDCDNATIRLKSVRRDNPLFGNAGDVNVKPL